MQGSPVPEAEDQAPSEARPRRVRFGCGPDATRPALTGVGEPCPRGRGGARSASTLV